MKKRLRITAVLAGILIVVLLMLYMTGIFTPGRIKPGSEILAPQKPPPDAAPVRVVQEEIPQWYEAVGTVRPRTETRVSSQINGRILAVLAKPGQRVAAGDELIRLDDREFAARLDQARQGLAAAEAKKRQAFQALAAARAVLEEAEAAHDRTSNYYRQQAATRQDLEQATAAYQQARAGVEQAEGGVSAAAAAVEQARKKVEEAQIALGYTVITSPVNGQISGRLADPGDTALAGRPLLTIQTADSLRLEALVREGLVNSISPGQKMRTVIDALQVELQGTVEEIVPSGDPASRTFLVKVGLPPLEGVYSGMFGRLYVPLPPKTALLLPRDAVRRIGQLETVRLLENGQLVDVFVKTGSLHGDRVEILAGLRAGDRVY